MQKLIFTALAITLLSGLAIGLQSSLISAAGKSVGPTLTGLLVNAFAGSAAGLLLVVLYARQGNTAFSAIPSSTFGAMAVAGLLGIGVIAGVAYGLPRIGIAAGISMIITGQMIVAVLVDTFGLLDAQPIPLNWARMGGLALLALGTWLILPRA